MAAYKIFTQYFSNKVLYTFHENVKGELYNCKHYSIYSILKMKRLNIK